MEKNNEFISFDLGKFDSSISVCLILKYFSTRALSFNLTKTAAKIIQLKAIIESYLRCSTQGVKAIDKLVALVKNISYTQT
jgi:hypothetical protein